MKPFPFLYVLCFCFLLMATNLGQAQDQVLQIYPLRDAPGDWFPPGATGLEVRLVEKDHSFALYLVAVRETQDLLSWSLPFDQALNVKTLAYVYEGKIYVLSEQPYSALQHLATYSFDGQEVQVIQQWAHDPSLRALERIEELLEQGFIGEAIDVLENMFYPYRYYDPHAMLARFLSRGHELALEAFHSRDMERACTYLDPIFSSTLRYLALSMENRTSYINSPMEQHLPFSTFIVILNDYGFFLEQAGRYEDAVEVLRDVLRMDPYRLVAQINLADALWGLYLYHQASHHYRMYWERMEELGREERVPDRVTERVAMMASIIENRRPRDVALYFEDSVLMAIVHQALYILNDPIMASEAEGLTHLILNCNLLTSLAGIEQLTGLEEVHVNSYSITDLSPLSALTGLKSLSITCYAIHDLSFLSSLQELQSLRLYCDVQADLSFLEDLHGLEDLHLYTSRVLDAEGLKHLENLRRLSLPYVQMEDHSFLKNLILLEELHLGSNPLQDFDDLSHLENLRHLHLTDYEAIDISPLGSLTQLESLHLSAYPAHGVEGLENLTGLKFLRLVLANPQDLQTIALLKNLQSLDLAVSNIEDVSLLADLSELERLHLEYNEIEDLSPLQNMEKLKVLGLTGNRVRDITPLKNLTELENVYLNDNKIEDISPLLENPAFGEGAFLSLDYNGLDISPASLIKEQIEELQHRGAIVFYEYQSY